MYIKIILCVILNIGFQSCYKGAEFKMINSYENRLNKKLEKAKNYVLLKNINYTDFSEKGENYQMLKNIQLRADKLDFLNVDTIKIFDNIFRANKYRVEVKTKVIGTRGIRTVTYTDRTLKLNLDIINDKDFILRDSILNRILITSENKKNEDYYAPWVIQLNSRGVFHNCSKYVLWDKYYTKDDVFAYFWVNNKFFKFSLLPLKSRFDKAHFEKRKQYVEKHFSEKEYLKDFEEQYFYDINKVDYTGFHQFTQGCSFFIEGNEGGIKWDNNECEVKFECESNIESKEILNLFK